MFRNLSFAAIVLFAGAFTPQICLAECSQHTFDPCPEPQPAYHIEVDKMTGRTWLKESQAAPTDDKSTLSRLAAVAKNVSPGALAKAAQEAHSAGWRTQVEAETKSPPLQR
jgi:hypothetical protein